MPRLIVIVPDDTAPGFALAGVTTLVADTATAAEATLRDLVDAGGEAGLIAVHAAFWVELDPELRRRLETTTVPLVVPLPAGAAGGAEADRRLGLQATLASAVGYELTFGTRGAPA